MLQDLETSASIAPPVTLTLLQPLLCNLRPPWHQALQAVSVSLFPGL